MENIYYLIPNEGLQLSSSIWGLILLIVMIFLLRTWKGKIFHIAVIFIEAIILANVFGLQKEMLMLINYTFDTIREIIMFVLQVISNKNKLFV